MTTCPEHAYPETRRISYAFEEAGTAVFVPVCMACGRYVKGDDSLTAGQVLGGQPTATCSKCGRTRMPFEGFF